MKQDDPVFVKGLITGVIVCLAIFLIFRTMMKSNEQTAEVPEAAETVTEVTEVLPFPARGPKDAPVKLIEYGDFHCGFCKKAYLTLKKVYHQYAGKIYWEFRHFPLSATPGTGSFPTHEASLCAQKQGKFWEFHDQVFSMSRNPKPEELKSIASQIGLDLAAFESCLSQNAYADYLIQQREQGVQEGVQGTPHFKINEQVISGARPYHEFVKIIEGVLDPSKAPVKKAGNPVVSPPRQAPSTVVFNDLDGKPFEGPKNAPVTVVEFSDFHCPFCQRVLPALKKLMDQYPGKIRRVWRHFPLPIHSGAERTHEASECAHEQGRFWEYHDVLFQNVGKLRTDEALVDAAVGIGLKREPFESCLNSGRNQAKVQQDLAKGAEVGVSGTPATFINGKLVSGARPYEYFEYEVESVLNPGKAKPPAEPARTPPPQQMVEFKNLGDRPAKGVEKAKVTVVEFSDFHCPFCKRAQPALQQVMKDYEGKVRLVWWHYPLPFHKGADRTHQASECAHQQGKFWEYHDMLFETMGQARSDESLISIAKELEINAERFQACLESNEFQTRIEEDLKQANEYGVGATPTFFINGRRLTGAQPYDRFKTLIDQEMAKSS